jgi:hypothetical protein
MVSLGSHAVNPTIGFHQFAQCFSFAHPSSVSRPPRRLDRERFKSRHEGRLRTFERLRKREPIDVGALIFGR